MLNTFPSLLSYSPIAPFILRVVLGLIAVDLGLLQFRKERASWIAAFETFKIRPAKMWVRIFASLEILGGILLIIGLYTQLAALAFVLLFGAELYIEYNEGQVLKRDLTFYVLVFAIALSILLTGAGAFAFDIPL